jgi:hypothetical protein
VLLLIGEVLGIVPLEPHSGILSHWLSKSMAGPRYRLRWDATPAGVGRWTSDASRLMHESHWAVYALILWGCLSRTGTLASGLNTPLPWAQATRERGRIVPEHASRRTPPDLFAGWPRKNGGFRNHARPVSLDAPAVRRRLTADFPSRLCVRLASAHLGLGVPVRMKRCLGRSHQGSEAGSSSMPSWLRRGSTEPS